MANKVKDLIKKIAGTEVANTIVFTAEVVSVEGETCTVDFSGLHLSDVNLSAVSNGSVQNLLITPKVGSIVTVADLSNGDKRILNVITWSEIDAVRFNGGTLGGLVNIDQLTAKLNALVDRFNAHTHTVSTTGTAAAQTGTAAAITSTAPDFNSSDYEDPKITH